jgi:hypothetical protein
MLKKRLDKPKPIRAGGFKIGAPQRGQNPNLDDMPRANTRFRLPWTLGSLQRLLEIRDAAERGRSGRV